jgi:NADH dehydrogenase
VAQLGRFHFSGFFAWFTWLFVHVVQLIGFKRKIAVLWSWTWNYITYRRGARLITGDTLETMAEVAPQKSHMLKSPESAEADPEAKA